MLELYCHVNCKGLINREAVVFSVIYSTSSNFFQIVYFTSYVHNLYVMLETSYCKNKVDCYSDLGSSNFMDGESFFASKCVNLQNNKFMGEGVGTHRNPRAEVWLFINW